ncbi:MAG: peptidoglycan DD-metalloendopeptidase family protein [bacterium]|nr:peptidoglycan DD-metalloendopeptidase family protein [bacterium]
MKKLLIIILICVTTLNGGIGGVFAQEHVVPKDSDKNSASSELQQLEEGRIEQEKIRAINESISDKKSGLSNVNRKIDKLEKEIGTLRRKASSLENEVAIIDNRVAKIELDVEATDLQISALLDEIIVLDRELDLLLQQHEQQRLRLKGALQEIMTADQQNRIFLVFGTSSFSEFFDRVRFFERVNSKMKKAIQETNEIRSLMDEQRDGKEQKLSSVQDLSRTLIDQQDALSRQQAAKVVLASETRSSEAEYKALVQDLQSEQVYIQSQIAALQEDVNRRLQEEDNGGTGSSVLSWPLETFNNRITSLFHDADYPFRHLFEHSGLDIAAPRGSAILSPAPGYVAWTRVGRLYGNYIMVIHANGVATLYAHMSSFDVVPDQFVARGDILGRVGTTGLSTGPHLHFEVRKNGIPTNPSQYVITP